MINAWNVERYYDNVVSPINRISHLEFGRPRIDYSKSSIGTNENLGTRLIVRRDYLADDTMLGGLSLGFPVIKEQFVIINSEEIGRDKCPLPPSSSWLDDETKTLGYFFGNNQYILRFCLKLFLLSILWTIRNTCEYLLKI